MGFIKEFKEFAVKGNVIDLAVGVIIGGAFGKIIDSFINDLTMPIIAAIIGSPDFSTLYIDLKDKVPDGTPLAEAKKLGPVFAYGNFITVAINFLLLAMVIFMMVKAINRLKRKEPPPATTVEEISSTDKLLVEIRDALRNRL
ncbi:MAG TPA: large conductance mechanosensitive channel protein MscL [Chitinophagaceae bacterium]|nr:large conductance mechanosensitive channel protein MscL [Chitinophagaceae bacterium]